MSGGDVVELLKLIWPLILLQVALAVWGVFDIVKNRSTRSLSPVWWILIVVFINLIGPIAYVFFGRKEA